MHVTAHPSSSVRTVLAVIAAVPAAAAVLGACTAPEPRFFEQRIYSMGTWVDVTVGARDAASAEAAIEDVEAMLHEFETDYYAWADGELKALNEGIGAGRAVPVSEPMAALLAEARRLSGASGGAFEPGVGGLVELWGLHQAPSPAAEDPPAEAIAAWLDEAGGVSSLTIENGVVRAAGPPVFLDLGGIAKGEAVDRAIELLRRNGIRDALVNAGGDVRALGTRSDRPWRIGIADPRGDGVLGVIELEDGEAAFTSGDYERFFEDDGQRRHHIIDPRTGYPAAGTQAVTVIAANGVVADAAATAVFVAGADAWRQTAEAMGVAAALRVDADGTVETLGTMRERLERRSAEQTDVVAES